MKHEHPFPFPDLPTQRVPLPDLVPWDVPISSPAGYWLSIQCQCGTKYMPLRLMAAKRGWDLTLRFVVPRLSCSECHSRPSHLSLVDDPTRMRSRELDLLI